MTCFPENLQDTDNGQLFSGTEKEERFRKIIKRLLHGHEGDMIYDRCRLLRGALSLTKVSYNIMTSPVCSMAVVRFSQHLVPGSRVPVPWYIIPTGLTHITWYRYGTWWTSYLERSTGNWYQVPWYLPVEPAVYRYWYLLCIGRTIYTGTWYQHLIPLHMCRWRQMIHRIKQTSGLFKRPLFLIVQFLGRQNSPFFCPD